MNSAVTSAAILKYFYQEPDLFALKQAMESTGIGMLTGHVNVRRYLPIFGCREVATFFRHPVAQVASHYEHHVRHLGYSGSFEQFIEENRFRNMQSRTVSALLPALLGFIGLTERYNESIELFNSFYQRDFASLSLNASPSRKQDDPRFPKMQSMDKALFRRVTELNSDDMRVYHAAELIFDERLKALRKGKRYGFGIVHGLNSTQVSGLAFGADDDAAEVEIRINGKPVAVVRAAEPRLQLAESRLPREGFVGFTYRFREAPKIGDKVECVLAATGQVLRGANVIEN
ncbi:hypothetical protein Q4485_00005 [Granulosicoccaceae sp. 1_MG-2023]|nr:hypothetical protein [Granulosicoccaceae sp. 1_MG-2023]